MYLGILNVLIKERMVMANRLEYIKQSYPDTMVLIKNGNFYRCYNDDPYILAYLLDYKVCSTDQSDMSGFPKDSLKKVLDALEKNNVNYRIMKITNGKLEISR
jgi:DNA mismatch repair ATPase MutS